MTKKQRNANLDLLRIVSMLLIVFLHSIDHSGVLENALGYGRAMHLYVRFTYALCMVCVNIYIMLSGYFMVSSKFRLQKLVTLWMEAAFYSFVLKLIFMLTGQDDFSIVSLVSCFVPILTGRYWFLTIYVGMYLVSPFLNTLIRAMDKRQHALLNVVLFAVMSVWVSVHPSIAGMNSGGGWGLAWFVTLYITASWLRLYYTPDNKPLPWFVGFAAIPAGMALVFCLAVWGYLPGLFATVTGHWYRYDSAPVYLMTMCLFVGFLNVRIPSGKLSRSIVRVAPLTLGVYLIHAHANVSPWSWAVLELPARMASPLFPLIQLGAVLGIFVLCAALDAVRSTLFAPLEQSRGLHRLCRLLEAGASAFFDKIISGSN